MNSKSVLITFPTEASAECFIDSMHSNIYSATVKRTSDDCLVRCITTKYHGPTNKRGSRISARCASGKVIIALDHSVRLEEAHRQAAEALREKMGWKGQMQGGALPDGMGYAFVFVTFE